MKILFYINKISDGGAERVIVNLANSFSNIGYEAVMVTSLKTEKEYPLNEKVKRLVLLQNAKKHGFIRKNIKLTSSLRKAVKEEKPDIVISFMAEPNFRAIVSTLGMKTKTLISVRNDPNKEYPSKVYRFLARHLYKKADGIVFQTEDAKAWFSDTIQKKSEIIANDVNPVFFETEYIGGKDIVTLGRLCEQKNHKLLINAYKKIADKHPDVNLRIYGAGPLEEELKGFISEMELSDRVFLMGKTMDSQKVLSTAKCFVLSSDYEGMPNALLEALVVGVPSISTDCPCGGPRALIDNGKNGILVPINDVDAISEALDKLISDVAFAKKLSENAKESSERFKPDIVFGNWKKFVENIVSEVE